MENILKEYKQHEEKLKKLGYDVQESRKYVVQKSGVKTGRVLEIGTGKGYLTSELARLDVKVLSVDIDRKSQKQAKQYLQAKGLFDNVTFKVINAEKLPFKNSSFDCVISMNLIHHLEDPKRCIREMVRVARDSVVIAEVNKNGANILRKMHAQKGHSHPEAEISLLEIKMFLNRLGFEINIYRHTCNTVLVCRKG